MWTGGCVGGGRVVAGRPWACRVAAGLGPVPGGRLGSTGRPGAYAAAARRSSKILSCSAVPVGPLVQDGPEGLLGPALACLGLWAGGRLGLAVSGHVTGSKGSRSCITDLKKSERKGKVP